MDVVSPHDGAILDAKKQVSYAAVAALTWMTWDTIIHFDIEVACLWRGRSSWVEWIYGCIRYLPIIHGGVIMTLLNGSTKYSSSGCRSWLLYQLIFTEGLTLLVEIILVMRLYVLYNQNKWILWVIITAFIAEIVIMISALVIVVPKMTLSSDCLVVGSPSIYLAYWLSSLVFEAFLFVLTLLRTFQSVTVSLAPGGHSITYIFMRDGTWAFALIFAAMLLNALMYKLRHDPFAGMGYYWVLSVMSFAGSHVLLNIRRLGVSDSDGPQSPTTPTIIFDSIA